jgi:hypothetical protein
MQYRGLSKITKAFCFVGECLSSANYVALVANKRNEPFESGKMGVQRPVIEF